MGVFHAALLWLILAAARATVRSAFEAAAEKYQSAIASGLIDEFEQCEQLLRQHLAADSKGSTHGRALFLLGAVTEVLDRPHEAIRSFTRALPHLSAGMAANAHYNIGQLHLHQGETALAAEVWDKAAAMNPGDSQLAIAQSRALTSLGRMAEATVHFERARSSKPSDPSLYYEFARATELTGVHHKTQFEDSVKPYFEKSQQLALSQWAADPARKRFAKRFKAASSKQ
jgi:tetratricopeptide (TPR) repeat protein